jgi:hypothetical protein
MADILFGDFNELFDGLKWPESLVYEDLDTSEVNQIVTKISSLGRVFRNLRVDRKQHKYVFQYPHKKKLHLTRMSYKFSKLGPHGILFNLTFDGYSPVLDKILSTYFTSTIITESKIKRYFNHG